jgi:hypothetical protein
MAGKRMLLGMVVVGVFCSAAFALAPMGPPMAGLPQGAHSVGIGFAHSDMNLEVSGTVGSTGGGAAVINDIQSDMYYLCLGYGISNDWTLYGGIGTADSEFPADGSGARFEGDSAFGFAIGTKRTLAENGDTKWGVLGQISQGKSEDTITAASGQSFGNGSITGPFSAGARHAMKLEWYEVQVALGPTVPISEDICVYGGPFLHFVEGDLEIRGSRAEFELEQRLQLGAYAGVLANIGDVGSLNNVSVMAELLWTGEAWGVGIGATIRCP